MFAFQISFDSLFGVSDSAGQFDLGEVMSVETLDVAFVSAGDGLLRLDYFQVVGDAGSKAILAIG